MCYDHFSARSLLAKLGLIGETAMTAPIWLFHQTTSLSKVVANASASNCKTPIQQLKQIKTMAGVRKIQKGDLVLYKKNFCIVAEIRNPIGFNHFDVMDFDGKMFPAVLRQEMMAF